MQKTIRPQRLLTLAGLLALTLALPGCKSSGLHPAATKKVDLSVTLDTPIFVNLPPMVIVCRDTVRNSNRQLEPAVASTVDFYIGTEPTNPTSPKNRKLFIYDGTSSSTHTRSVGPLSNNASSQRRVGEARFKLPDPPLKGRQYVIAYVMPGTGNEDLLRGNNLTSQPINFGP